MIELDFTQALAQFELDIKAQLPSKGITAIFGRSGAGKTSVINAISGLKNPTQGRIKIDDKVLFDSQNNINLAIEKRQIGYVFQEARLFPHYRVKGNLLYGCQHKDKAKFTQVVELLGLNELLHRYPADLSGGEKQRCAIARALLSNPKLLLMDEPLASLDLPRKQEVLPFLEKLAREIEVPILYVTHSLDEILHLADHMLLLEQGKVQAFGRVEQMWQSAQLSPWLTHKEKSSLFNAKVTQHQSHYALSYISLMPKVGVWMSALPVAVGENIRIRIYANDVSLSLSHAKDSSIRNILPARIVRIDEVFDRTKQVSVQVCFGDDAQRDPCLWSNITAWAYDDLQLSVGMAVFVQIKGVSMTNQDLVHKLLSH